MRSDTVEALPETYEVCYTSSTAQTGQFGKRPPRPALRAFALAQEHILSQHDGKERFVYPVSNLSKALALTAPSGVACLKVALTSAQKTSGLDEIRGIEPFREAVVDLSEDRT